MPGKAYGTEQLPELSQGGQWCLYALALFIVMIGAAAAFNLTIKALQHYQKAMSLLC